MSEAINSNIFWSQYFWDFCSNNKIPFMYHPQPQPMEMDRSFSDNMTLDELKNIKIHNIYGWSKMYFDIFALSQKKLENAHLSGMVSNFSMFMESTNFIKKNKFCSASISYAIKFNRQN